MAKGNVYRAIVELLVAGALWGFGIVASKWMLDTFSPAEALFLRFLLVCLIGLPLILATKHSVERKLRMSFWPGVLLAGTIGFMTWGLEYTTPTKCGFITTLYVVFVPILESVLLRKRLNGVIWACVLVAMIGTGLIVNIGVAQINIGDVLTFVGALLATGQIYWMGSVSPRLTNAFVFNLYQCFWSLLIFVPFINYSQFATKIANSAQWPPQVWVAIFSLVVGSTLTALYLQVRAQKELSRTVSSLLFLLESPFAMIFSIILLGEHLTLRESAGAFLIFVSAAVATRSETR